MICRITYRSVRARRRFPVTGPVPRGCLGRSSGGGMRMIAAQLAARAARAARGRQTRRTQPRVHVSRRTRGLSETMQSSYCNRPSSPAEQSSHCNRPSSPAEQSSHCNRPSRAMAAQRTDDGHGGTARSADASDSNHCETGGDTAVKHSHEHQNIP